ncbi:MAG: RNA helicase [Betaproteobacteria bacterium HGW-Betaproteobacteria-12]|nr:MAG: RNA helicase [Betaproteobacteria bacterium HGW-Betaproteobacteria-12]
MLFSELGLKAEIQRAVADQGYDTPTPIQQQAIPAVLAGHDLMATAQTGTGKTAGFTLPILHLLASGPNDRLTRVSKTPRVLVLTPTRELAIQVEESVRTYGKHLPINSLAVFGGVGINPQIANLRRGVDILVATPGRLLDHVQQRTVDLSAIEIFVLDEADRMLDMGFIRDIRKVIALLPKKRQNLMFSATFSPEIRELASGLLHQPVSVDVAPRNTAAELVTQKVIETNREQKKDLLEHLFQTRGLHQVLVFARTKHGADALAKRLDKSGIKAAAIHGDKSQGARTRALSDFKDGKLVALVATDIAARGIDIDALPYVINYELPNMPEDYVHRIGRTGRAGMEGEAISLVCHDERGNLKDIEKLIKRSIERVVVPGFEPSATAAPRPVQPPRQPRSGQPAGRPQGRNAAAKPGGPAQHRSGSRHR